MPDNTNNTTKPTNPTKITYTRYHPNGNVKHIITRVNNQNHGYETEYSETGQVIYKCIWSKGKNLGWGITSKL